MKEYIIAFECPVTENSERIAYQVQQKLIGELIRCKDCKYWQLEHYVGGQGMSCQMMNSDDVCLTEPTNFCCWAERKK